MRTRKKKNLKKIKMQNETAHSTYKNLQSFNSCTRCYQRLLWNTQSRLSLDQGMRIERIFIIIAIDMLFT